MKTLNPIPNMALTIEPTAVKSWTVLDYHRTSEMGILGSDERTELMNGQILLKASKSPSHALALRLLSMTLDTVLADQPFFVRTQDPIQLDDWSEPEPDLAIMRGTVLDYADHHPRPEEIELVVEVADSTLKQDGEIKDKLYAQAGIADYWVLDLKDRQLHVFRNPLPQATQTISFSPNPTKSHLYLFPP
jgi:Uma2 family endonuclease